MARTDLSGSWPSAAPTGTAPWACFVATVWLIALGTSCTWVQPPGQDKAVVAPTEIRSTPGGEAESRLYPVRDGLWAYVYGAPRDSGASEPGDLLIHRGRDRRGGTTTHLFAVVAARNWGAMLQRLDNAAPPAQLRAGRLVPATVRAPNVPDLPRVCVGRGRPDGDHPCLADAPRGRRWYMYRLNAKGRLTVPEKPTDTAALPIRRRGLLHRKLVDGAFSWVGAASDGKDAYEPFGGRRWLAVPTARAWEDPPAVGIALGSGCSAVRDQLSDTRAELTTLEAKTLPTHPLGIEGMAFQTGADLLVNCSEKTVTLAVPSLLRESLTTMRGDDLGPPLLGRRPRTVRAHAVTPDLVLGLAALAAGDPVLAEFRLLRWLRGANFDRPTTRDLAIAIGQLAAAVGRPETGLRLGRTGSRSDWHPRSNLAWQLSRAAALAAFDRRNRYLAQLQIVRESAGSDRRLAGWLQWSQFQVRLDQSPPPASAFREHARRAADQGRPGWSAAYHLAAALYRPGAEGNQPDTMVAMAQDRGAGALAESVVGRPASLACPETGPCRLDVYGRRLTPLLKSVSETPSKKEPSPWITRLLETGEARYRPGFDRIVAGDADIPTPEDLESTALLAVAAGWTAESERTMAPVTAPVARRIRQGACPTGGLHAGVMRAVEIAGTRPGAAVDFLRGLHWLLAEWLPGACRAPARAAAQLREAAQTSASLAAMGPDLLPALVAGAPDRETRRRAIEEAGNFAVEHRAMAAFCKRWYLAVALAEIERGRPREADRALASAVNCPNHEGLAVTESVLTAYVAFERTGQLPRRTDPAVERRLRPHLGQPAQGRSTEATNRCVGLAPFEYSLGEAVDPEVARLAEDLAVQKKRPRETLTLQTTSDRLAAATNTLEAGKDHLKAGRFAEALESIRLARNDFEDLDFQPGILQTRFLLETFFGDRSTVRRPAKERRDNVPTDLRAAYKSEGTAAAARKDGTSEKAQKPAKPAFDPCEPDGTVDTGTPRQLRCLFARGDAQAWLDGRADSPSAGERPPHGVMAVSLVLETRQTHRRRAAEAPALVRKRLCEPNS